MQRGAEERLEVVYRDPDNLKKLKGNPRDIDPDERRRLKQIIQNNGFVKPLVVREETDVVLGGNQRLDIARELSIPEVPVTYVVGLADEEAAELAIALNNPEAQGHWDYPKLANVLEHLEGRGRGAHGTGFSRETVEEILTWEPDDADDDTEEEDGAEGGVADAVGDTVCPECGHRFTPGEDGG